MRSPVEPGWYVHSETWWMRVIADVEQSPRYHTHKMSVHYVDLELSQSEWLELVGSIAPSYLKPTQPPEKVLLHYMKWLTAGQPEYDR